jgi:ATP-dependent helicase/nuclease subunit A
MSAEIKWTPRQREGIERTGGSLLVSAAAGSGKTAVLAERCAHLVCEATEPCDIDELLVVTFTESAAAEMKARIQQALRRKFEHKRSDRLARQVRLAQHAHVSTLHGFCYRLLKQNFTVGGVDPAFSVLDADEAALLRVEIATDLFHRRYETDDAGNFQRLIDAYGDGDDESLIRQVVATHELLASLTNPRQWLEDSARAMREAAQRPLEESDLGRSLLMQIDGELTGLVRKCEGTAKTIAGLGGNLGPYVEHAQELLQYFRHWQAVLKSHGVDALVSEVRDFRAAKPKLPTIKGDVEGKALGKSLIDELKYAVDRKPLEDLLFCESEQWRDGMRRVAPHAQEFLSLVLDFSKAYLAAKSAPRALDFSDLERMALKILRDGESDRPSALAKALHGQFRFVLVDEYQDINPIQDAILRLVSTECVKERGANLFCVGDVKQSIFRFRLAEPRRFLDRHRRFLDSKDAGQVIDLRENFRSRAPLLEAINGVFERLMTEEGAEIEYDESHRLKAAQTFPEAGDLPAFKGAPIELHFLPEDCSVGESDDGTEELERVDYEAMLLARRIREIMGMDGSPRMHVADDGKMRPIELGDIVVLLRTMRKKADRFADVIRAHGIEVFNEGGGGLFEATEVRDILCLLQILDNQKQDIPLAAVLRSPISGLPDPDDGLARIRLAYPGEKIPFHEAVRKYSEKDDELGAFLRDFLKRISRWREAASRRPVAETLWRIYQETGYLGFCGALDDGAQRVANLMELHERAAQFGTFLRQGLYRFLKFVQSLKEETDVRRPSAAATSEHAVRIMSIHRSKGLEFPVVLLPDLGKHINVSDARGAILTDREMGLGMDAVDEQHLIRYPSLASTLVRQSLLRQTMAEELRLLYVAMTRAKEHLILVGTCTAEDRDGWETQWGRHKGPLPADVIRGARRAVDWIGPVEAATRGVFHKIVHAPDEVRQWKNPRHDKPKVSKRQERLMRMEPLAQAPKINPPAKQLIERFSGRYAFDPFTRVQAAISVTALAKDRVNTGKDPLQRKLDLPKFFESDSTPKATDIGNATHTVLQYFDFRRQEIEGQIQELVDRKLLGEEEAKWVDRGAIQWLLTSDVGKLIRANHARLIRETPFALMRAAPDCPPSGDAMNQMMVRGRIDLLVPTNDGLAIVDYKTDRVTGADLEERARGYQGQMEMYGEAIRKFGGGKVLGVYLVFLAAREIRMTNQI